MIVDLTLLHLPWLQFMSLVQFQVASVKKKIEEEKGEEFSSSSQKLIHSGKIMEDEKTLKDYKVSEKGFIVVMVTSKSKPAVETPATTKPETPMETKTEAPTAASPVASEEPKEEKKSEVRLLLPITIQILRFSLQKAY